VGEGGNYERSTPVAPAESYFLQICPSPSAPATMERLRRMAAD